MLQTPLPRTVWGRGALAWDGDGEGAAAAAGRLVVGGDGTPAAAKL